MNVLLVSQCEKRALTETRRILDQFAERRGDRTWQTSITQVGLDTLRKMLKKTARKNTAVVCHWIRGKDHSEIVWIVGNAGRFNELGAVPTNTTQGDVLRTKDESNWQSLEDIHLLAAMASLFHDFGKASRAFQSKLRSTKPMADAYRHEWVSLRLFEAFVGSDADEAWLQRLRLADAQLGGPALNRLLRDDRPGAKGPFLRGRMGPLAQAVGWLIVSHHRLPVPAQPPPAKSLQYLLGPLSPEWNGARSGSTTDERAACWEFPKGTPFDSRDWSRRAGACARRMLDRSGFVERAGGFLDDPHVMHVARLALMLADHHYSSIDSHPRYGDPEYSLYANTDRKSGQLKQRLDEHLAGVASHARRVVRALPRLERELPRIARCKAFQKRSANSRFRWQDRAYELAVSLRDRAAEHGFFGINMASTGCGKTLANGRIAYGLADPQRGARFTVALGLRTLTLQTGAAYRDRLALSDDDLAVIVGGGAVKDLFELDRERSRETSRAFGSESAEDLLVHGSHVHFEGSLQEGPLKRWLGMNSNGNKLLQAPVVVCTIDHLVPATESLRAGHQIAPMLRLLTSDLVLDEPDDFDLDDLPALSRLVHWAGVLGSRIVLSSATLPPGLVEALFDAYRAGRLSYQRNCGGVERALAIPCAWFDEYRAVHSTHGAPSTFRSEHVAFVQKRLERLRKAPERRRLQIVEAAGDEPGDERTREDVCGALAATLPRHMLSLHEQHHGVDPKSSKRASFGLVRLANIEPLILLARGLASQTIPSDHALHLCVYHARHPLLMRSAIESMLDMTLKRHDESAVFDVPHVRQAMNADPAPNHLFVVMASPVAEVGRDHDYDWAIVEPSSMRSIIQLAGRIRRHREGDCEHPNLLALATNMRAMTTPGAAAFRRPGFEQTEPPLRLLSHDLRQVINREQWAPLDAAPRILEREQLQPQANLVDLEHAAIRAQLLGESASTQRFCAQHWWTTRAPLTGILQQAFRFRKSSGDEREYALLPLDEDTEQVSLFERVDEGWVAQGNLLTTPGFEVMPNVDVWGPVDYQSELLALAERTGFEPRTCAERFGRLILQPNTQGWEYHPSLGFKKSK